MTSWRVVPLQWLVQQRSERAGEQSDLPLLSVSIAAGVGSRAGDGQAPSDDLSAYKVVRPDEIVLNRMRAFQGAVGRSTQCGLVSPDYTVMSIVDGDPRFFEYLMRSRYFVGEMTASLRGIGDPHAANVRTPRINFSDLGQIRIRIPDVGVQRRVANYLDEECARIEMATLSLSRATELLHERYQAELEEIVLRPQGPHAPEKGEWPSPGSWQRRSLVDLSSKFVDGDWIEAPYITDQGVRLLQTGNVGIGDFREQGGRFVSDDTFDELRCTEVLPGDLLVCRLASPVGRACVAPDLGVRMIASVDVTIMRCGPAVEPAFVAAVLSTSSWLSRMAAEEQGSTRARIARTRLGEFRIPVPDIETQRQIAAAVREHRDATRHATALLNREAELLAERKQALITAAVTGEITV